MAWTRLEAQEVTDFVRETLFAPSRTIPVIAVTTSVTDRKPWLDPEELAETLGDRAQVVLLETGDATWALSAHLPPRLDAYGGAVRIWWPGLTRESHPFDHPLLLIRDRQEAEQARNRILSAILGNDAAAGRRGNWRPRAERADAQPRGGDRGSDAWARIAEGYSVGDVVPARVFRLEPRFALVELLPGAGIVVPLAEIDYTWVRDPSEILTVGERVNVKLLELDPPSRRGYASIKQALLATPREGISVRPGGPPYLAAESVEEGDAHLRRALQREREVNAKLGAELEAAITDRERLALHNEALRQQVSEVRKELKSAEGRLEARTDPEHDPVASDVAFLAAVRVEYGRRYDEADRFRYPLARMRVGRAFLDALRSLEGIDIMKVVEVGAQVASGRAHEIPARLVHELTAGVGGRSIVRPSDGAKAWRCALQVGTPSARRLHWWAIPQPGGVVIEFASVAVHDDYSMPQ
jgi:predicted RNA-binding protein with RPS1 domain